MRFDQEWLNAYNARQAERARLCNRQISAGKPGELQGNGAPIGKPAEREADLHDQIIGECRRRGWLPIHARMDMANTLTVGAPDFEIYCDGGRTLHVEAKRKDGKVRPEQRSLHAWASRLGHTVHVVRSLEEFLAVCNNQSHNCTND